MVCFAIVTDEAVQGISAGIHSSIDFYSISYKYPFSSRLHPPSNQGNLLFQTPDGSVPISLPGIEELRQLIIKTNSSYDEVFCILSAGYFTQLSLVVDDIAEKNKSKANFHLIDSQTFSAGQGYLVNKTIQMIEKNVPPKKIDTSIREIIPNIYTLLGSPNLSFLHASGFLDAGQMVIGDQHAIIPLFSLENGKLSSLEKFRNMHGISDYLLEFLEEFERIEQLIFIYPATLKLQIFNEIKQVSHENHEITSYYEFSSNEFLSNLIGPEGFGMILIE